MPFPQDRAGGSGVDSSLTRREGERDDVAEAERLEPVLTKHIPSPLLLYEEMSIYLWHGLKVTDRTTFCLNLGQDSQGNKVDVSYIQ